jgi:cytidyltransferase-like protein
MLKFGQYHKQILGEASTEDTLKSHLSHLEDLAVEEGKNGFAKFVEQVENFTNYIEGLRSKTSVNLKIDGSPAIFFGIDPRPEYKERFFIATKSVFSAEPKLVHSVEEVEQYYGDADPQLKNILKTVFPHLEAGYDGSGKLYQSDLLFSPARPPTQQTIEGKEYLVFKPQLIAYAIPVDNESKLYRLASKAQVGLVVHKGFNVIAQNNRLIATPAGRDTTSIVLSLRKVGVFAEGSNYNTLDIQLDPTTRNNIHAYLSKAKKQIDSINDEFNAQYISDTGLVGYLKQYLNEMVRTSGGIFKAAKMGEPFDINKFYEGFINFVNTKIDKAASTKGPRAKANAEAKKNTIDTFLRQNNKQFASLIGATYSMISIKNIFLRLLSNVKHELSDMKSFIPAGDKFITAPGEGHVLYIGDTPNQVKIVDRLDFSANNFKYGGPKARTTAAPSLQENADTSTDKYSIGYYCGSFSPPHIGHFEAAKMAAQENDEVYIVVSATERDESGITLAKKMAIWSLYMPLLTQYKAKINLIVPEVNPVRTVYEHVAVLNDSPEANNIIVNLYTDPEEAERYKSMSSYSENLAALNLKPTPRIAEAKVFRAYLAAGNKNGAFELMPRGVDKEAVWRVLATF